MVDPSFSIYIHVPFCKKKCDYCHFYVVKDNFDLKKKYLESLKKEISLRKALFFSKRLVTIYFGGGTPSLLTPPEIQFILEELGSTKEMEITLEVNPETTTLERMKEFQKSGINRVSIGVQSLDESLLKILSREHGSKQALQCIQDTRESGIENISIDLMYDIPFQTLDSFSKTLDLIEKEPITHLSLYNLTFEPQTVFFKKKEIFKSHLPSDSLSLSLLELACEKLRAFGFERYEISAFAKSGFQAVHNKGYWTARPFLGLGPSAFSFWEGKRFRNVSNLPQYFSKLSQDLLPIDFEEKLPKKERERELFLVNLRLLEGVFLHKFDLDDEALEEIEDQIKKGLLEKQADLIRLSHKGRLFYDSVAESLV